MPHWHVRETYNTKMHVMHCIPSDDMYNGSHAKSASEPMNRMAYSDATLACRQTYNTKMHVKHSISSDDMYNELHAKIRDSANTLHATQ